MQRGGACSVKMPALTWKKERRKERQKVSGLCDWQPMILRIRLDWTKCLGHVQFENPRAFFASVSITGLQGSLTKYPFSLRAWKGFPKHFKAANLFVPNRSLYLPRIHWQLVHGMWNDKLKSFCSGCFALHEHHRRSSASADGWVSHKANLWMNRETENLVTQSCRRKSDRPVIQDEPKHQMCA